MSIIILTNNGVLSLLFKLKRLFPCVYVSKSVMQQASHTRKAKSVWQFEFLFTHKKNLTPANIFP